MTDEALSEPIFNKSRKEEMEIKAIAIIGLTEMGCAIALATARAGYATILEDVFPSALEQGLARIDQELGEGVLRGNISGAERERALARIATAGSAEDACREADLVIEAVADEEEMKLELFTIFDKFARPGAIFATTTALFSITELAAITICAERCIGMRFLLEAQRIGSIELRRGRDTSDATVAAGSEVARRLGLDARVVSDGVTTAERGR